MVDRGEEYRGNVAGGEQKVRAIGFSNRHVSSHRRGLYGHDETKWFLESKGGYRDQDETYH